MVTLIKQTAPVPIAILGALSLARSQSMQRWNPPASLQGYVGGEIA